MITSSRSEVAIPTSRYACASLLLPLIIADPLMPSACVLSSHWAFGHPRLKLLTRQQLRTSLPSTAAALRRSFPIEMSLYVLTSLPFLHDSVSTASTQVVSLLPSSVSYRGFVTFSSSSGKISERLGLGSRSRSPPYAGTGAEPSFTPSRSSAQLVRWGQPRLLRCAPS